MADEKNGFKTSVANENEIMKAGDFTFAHDEGIANIGKGLKAILSGDDKSFVIGGKVTPAAQGGANIDIAPLFVYCSDTKECGITDSKTETIPITNNSVGVKAIVRAKITSEEYEAASRMYNSPETGTKYTDNKNTKKVFYVAIDIVTSTTGQFPNIESGYVKLAEITLTSKNTVSDSNIFNITARGPNESNDAWENEKDATYSPMYLTDVFSSFLEEHDGDGAHKQCIIHASNLDIGTGGDTVNLGVIQTGGRYDSIADIDGVSANAMGTQTFDTVFEHIKTLYPYAESIIGMFGYNLVAVDYVSTTSISSTLRGTLTIDGKTTSVGDTVLLANQGTQGNGGLYTVSSSDWGYCDGYGGNKEDGYYQNKLFYAKKGNNAGKVFFLSDSQSTKSNALEFSEASLSPNANPGSWVIRDENGRFKAAKGEDTYDVANMENIVELSSVDSTIREEMSALKNELENEIYGLDNDNANAFTSLQDTVKQLQQDLNELEAQHNYDTANIEEDYKTADESLKVLIDDVKSIAEKAMETAYGATSDGDSIYKTLIDYVDSQINSLKQEFANTSYFHIQTSRPDTLSAGDIWLA